MKPHALIPLAALALSAPLAVADSNTVTVYVFNYDYSQVNPNPPYPDPVPVDDPVIHVGDTIRWQRLSGTHNVRSCSGTPEQFFSQTMTASSTTYSHTYTHVGRFYYYCTFHGFDNGNGTAGGMSGYIDVVAPCAPDVGWAGGNTGFDGVLDNNDFIAFINLFFAADPKADVGKAGGLTGADGLFDNNDLIAYINLFFAGC